MPLMITDDTIAAPLIEARRENGLDGYDEVWNGVYVMSPLANNEHQFLVAEVYAALHGLIARKGQGRVFPGANVSDRSDDWTKNYRVPDVLVFLEGTSAKDCGTHFLGGPEFAVEVVSEGDRTLEKLDFYASVGTKELLVIDRDPWHLTLFRRNDDRMEIAAESVGLQPVVSNVIPAQFVLDVAASCFTVKGVQDSEDFPIRFGEPLV